MPDDVGEKTESPTPRRRQEAREKGQVARSNDLSAALLLLAGMIALRMFGPGMMSAWLRSFHQNLSVSDPAAFVSMDVVSLVSATGLIILSAAGPVMLAMLIVSVVSNLMQVGLLFTVQPLQPKLDKLSPIKGVTRLFSSRTMIQLAMNLFKLVLVSSIAYYSVKGRMSDIMLALSVGGWKQVAVLSQIMYTVGMQLAGALLVLALLDYAWQRYKFGRDLRMSKQEVKEEMRRMEGDPILKQRRRKMQLAATIQHIKSAVPTADVVVTNPTELAVAIKYESADMAAPKVVAKGADFLAKKIREIAIVHGIPIVERKPLAQALYKTVDVGQEVPEKFYKAIAEILAYVYKLSGKSMARKAAG